MRELHRKAQEVLKEHLTLEPVLPQQEEEIVTVPAGFDPSAIRLTGNITGDPPFKGTLQHHGWRVKDYKLPLRRKDRMNSSWPRRKWNCRSI